MTTISTKTERRAAITAAINSKAKSKYVVPNNKTNKMPVATLPLFVSKLIKVSVSEANVMIKNGEVSVNGDIVNDVNYVLVSGMIVRVGNGHILKNSGYMAYVA